MIGHKCPDEKSPLRDARLPCPGNYTARHRTGLSLGFDGSLDTTGQNGKLIFIPLRREVLAEASPREGFLGLLNRKLASANLAIFDTPLDLVISFESHGRANGLRESHSVFLVDYGRTHGGIIP